MRDECEVVTDCKSRTYQRLPYLVTRVGNLSTVTADSRVQFLFRVFTESSLRHTVTYCISSISNMSQPSSSESSFQVLFNTALQEYENQTGTNLVDHPFAKQLEECDSVDSVVIILQEQSQSFREFRGDGRLMKSLVCSVDVLYTMSTNTALGEGIGLVRPKALIGVRCS